MANTYIEYLREEFKKASDEFAQAKNEAINDLNRMTHFTAVDFGAAYATHIDKVTVAATKLKTIADSIAAYEYYQKEGTL